MTAIRTQVVPDSGVKTAAPALEPLLSEIHEAGRAGRHVRGSEDADALIPNEFRRPASLDLPEITAPQVVRHFTHLAQLNYAVDTGMYPLGSCTMKYNPKVNDRIAALAGFAEIHPRQDDDTIQGALRLMFELQELLAKLTGMDAATLQPAAGAHAEFTALLVFKAYHSKRGDAARRRRVIVPDTARRGRTRGGPALRQGEARTLPSASADHERYRWQLPARADASRQHRKGPFLLRELWGARARLHLYSDSGRRGPRGSVERRDPRGELPARAASRFVRCRVRPPVHARVRSLRLAAEKAGRVRT